jgi:hypothetical protein
MEGKLRIDDSVPGNLLVYSSSFLEETFRVGPESGTHAAESSCGPIYWDDM